MLTKQAAEKILSQIEETPRGYGETQIKSYTVTPLFGFFDLLPHSPWDGPPVPRRPQQE